MAHKAMPLPGRAKPALRTSAGHATGGVALTLSSSHCANSTWEKCTNEGQCNIMCDAMLSS